MAQHKRSTQAISGVVLLDKRIGVSSNAALQEVKRLFRARKAGHTGSLDPLASGLLPICMGEATKISSFLLNMDKSYRVKVKLGVATTTGDAEGEVVKRLQVPPLEENKINAVLGGFVGEITQIPPMYSALKHNGVRLYELARKGIEVERKSRNITIFKLSLIRIDKALLDLEVSCSKGTYVRTLAEDIGVALGCCGYVEQLHRTRVGDFDIADGWKVDDLKHLASDGNLKKCLLPVDAALSSWPSLMLSEELAFYVKRGQAVSPPRIPKERWVKLCTHDEQFFGIGEVGDDRKVAPRRLLNVKNIQQEF